MQHWPTRNDTVHCATMPETRVQASLLVLSLRQDWAWFKTDAFQHLRGESWCSSTPSGRLTLL